MLTGELVKVVGLDGDRVLIRYETPRESVVKTFRRISGESPVACPPKALFFVEKQIAAEWITRGHEAMRPGPDPAQIIMAREKEIVQRLLKEENR